MNILHLLSSQLRYQVLDFDKVIDFATIDRGANNGLRYVNGTHNAEQQVCNHQGYGWDVMILPDLASAS